MVLGATSARCRFPIDSAAFPGSFVPLKAVLETVCKAKKSINTGLILILGAAWASHLAASRERFTYKKCPIGGHWLPVWPQIQGTNLARFFSPWRRWGRAVVFLYTAPFFVALGSYMFLGERPRASQWAGLGLSFAGVALAIGVPQANVDANVLLGDLLIVAGGALWAATTLLVKATALINAPAEKGLGYQVAMSIPILGLAAWISGERITHVPSALSLSLLSYQAFWVVGLTFTLWFALVKTYSASKLSAFTFVTPLFGVVASYFIMHDKLTLVFGVAALLVITGLYLVNKSDPKIVPDPNVPA
jgi:uncharacterized membrane protein